MDEQTEELKQEIRDARGRMGTTIDQIEDRMRPGNIVERRMNRWRAGAARTRDRVMGMPSQAVDATRTAVGDAVGSVEDTAHATSERAQQATAGSPLMAGAVAFAVGAMVAAAFPPSEEETHLVEQLEPVVGEQVREVVDELKGASQESARQLVNDASATISDAAEAATDSPGRSAVG